MYWLGGSSFQVNLHCLADHPVLNPCSLDILPFKGIHVSLQPYGGMAAGI